MKTCRYCQQSAVLLRCGDAGYPCRREIDGFHGYQIDCQGTVWSCLTNHLGVTGDWHALKPKLSKKGPPFYHYVNLSRGANGQSNQYVHLLVLMAFIGQRPDGMEGCHNDGNSLNNAAKNLRWDTIKANRADSIAHGTLARGEDFPQAKLTDDKVRMLRARNAAGESPKALAKEFGIHKRNVFRVLNRDTWKHIV